MRKQYESPRVTREETLPTQELGRKIEEQPELAFARELLEVFPEGNVYVVGGTVRDAMLRRDSSKDYDLVVANVPREDLEVVLKKFGQVDLVGNNFGVYKIIPHGSKLQKPIEIALPRKDIAAGTGGRKDFDAQADHRLNITDDLARRDFTVNAMAWDMRTHALVDPYDGILDLYSKTIRAVRDPKKRFQEDYSRMLRGLRFAAKLGFEIEPETWKAMQDLMPRITDVRMRDGKEERVTPPETISSELMKGLLADPVATLDLWDAAGAIKTIMPELLDMKGCEQSEKYHSEGDVWTHVRLVLEKVNSDAVRQRFGNADAPAELLLAVLFHDIAKPKTKGEGDDRFSFHGHAEEGATIAKQLMDRMRFSASPDESVDHERVAWIILNHMTPLHADFKTLRKTTIEKLFFSQKFPSELLLRQAYADASASLRPDGSIDLSNLERLTEMLEAMKIQQAEQRALPLPLLNGHDVIQLLNIKPSRRVGELLETLREEQLQGRITSREAAETFLRSHPT